MKPSIIIWHLALVLAAALVTAGIIDHRLGPIAPVRQSVDFNAGYDQGCLDTYQGKSRVEIRELGDGKVVLWKKADVVQIESIPLPLPVKETTVLPELNLADPPKTVPKKK